jgi:hypothetical protein
MLSGSIPGSQASEWTKLALDTLANNPYPEFIKRNYYFAFGEEGIRTYTIFEIDKGKEEEGLKDIQNRVLKFAVSLKGMKSVLEPVFTVEEIFTMMSELMPSD